MLDDLLPILIITGITLALSLTVLQLRKRIPHNLDIDQKNLMSTNFSFFTTLYCFFLGFAVVTLWSNFNDTDTTVSNEAMCANNLYRLSDNLPQAGEFKGRLKEYVVSVLNDEWPLMAQGSASEKTEKIKND
ncbi:MAG: hypothetical protein HQK55_12980, partial [Deltaproteobacteria bacterium]|nr:hypothetical protein [Deltaproteobacteria bacterium]